MGEGKKANCVRDLLWGEKSQERRVDIPDSIGGK